MSRASGYPCSSCGGSAPGAAPSSRVRCRYSLNGTKKPPAREPCSRRGRPGRRHRNCAGSTLGPSAWPVSSGPHGRRCGAIKPLLEVMDADRPVRRGGVGEPKARSPCGRGSQAQGAVGIRAGQHGDLGRWLSRLAAPVRCRTCRARVAVDHRRLDRLRGVDKLGCVHDVALGQDVMSALTLGTAQRTRRTPARGGPR